MAMKLFDLIESWFGDILKKNINDKATQAVSDNMSKIDAINSAFDTLNDTLSDTKDELDDLIKQYGHNDKRTKDKKKELKDLAKQLDEENKKKEKLLRDLAKQTNLTTNEISDLIDEIRLHGVEAVNAGRSTNQLKNIMTSATKALGFDLKGLTAEFFTLSAVVAMATDQIVKSNEYLVQYARKVGGAQNYRTLGFDAYGNNMANTGSLSALTNINNISEEQFFEALGGFSKGKVIGQDYSKSASDLQRFATEQGKLIKLYGVSAGDIEKITEVSTQLYGVSIKQLNSEFEKGSQTAKKAGLNVQEYFKNLARASELIGETYIAGGTQGLEKLALFATRLNTSVDNLVKMGNNFKNISDIFEQQAKGTNLGLSNYAQQAGLLFAKTQLGLYEEANRIAVSALSKDVKKYTDKNGIIDQRGIRALNELGFDKEYIQLIQRTIQAQKKLGVSFEELTDISKLSTQKQMEYYAEMNRSATITEKLNKLWGQFKSVILDPIASVLGPALDIVINLLIATFQTLYFVLKPLIYVFQIIGKGLTKISDTIAGVTGFIEEKLKGFGIKSEKAAKIFDQLANIAGTVVAALIVLRGAAYATAAAQSLNKLNLGGMFGKLGSFLPGRGAGMARLAGMRLGGLAGGLGKIAPRLIKGAGIGLIGGLAGDAISQIGPEGGVMNRLGGAVSGAATGAAIGSIIPGIGTAIGAAVGGILGLFKFDEIKNGIFKMADWIKKIFGPISYIIPLFNSVVIIKDLISWFTKDKQADEEAKKIASQSYNTENIYNMLNNTLSQRTIDPLKAEKAQEKMLQNVIKPVIHVEQGLYGDAKVKLSGY